MKQPYGNALPVAPTRGDSCFRDDATLHFCFTDGVWTQISGGAGASAFTDLTDVPASYLGQAGNIVTVNPGETGLQFSPPGAGGTRRIEYGGACVALANATDMSCPFGIFPYAVNRPAADLFDHPGEYFGRCKFDVFETQFNTPGVIINSWKGLSFANVSALYAFMLANCTPGAGPNFIDNDAWIRWYDVVDDSADRINKIYGFNAFYGMLRGNKKYKDTQKSCANANWVNFPAWFNDLCNQKIGFPAGYVYAVGSEQNALWPSQTHAKMYGLPRPGFELKLLTTGNRWVLHSPTATFIPLPAVWDFVQNNASGDNPTVWCTLDMRARASWRWWNETKMMKYLMEDVSANYSSTIVLHNMRGQGLPGIDHRCVFVKPYGIDQAGLNWYDFNTYDLYGLYTQKDHSPVIRKLSPEQGFATNDLVWLPRMNWDIVSTSTQKRLTTKMVGKDNFAVQFFLRDKTTQKISRPSQARIVLSQRHRHAPFKYEVKG